jgi:hypothetical protein
MFRRATTPSDFLTSALSEVSIVMISCECNAANARGRQACREQPRSETEPPAAFTNSR